MPVFEVSVRARTDREADEPALSSIPGPAMSSIPGPAMSSIPGRVAADEPPLARAH
jgi:hypothetical protein